MFAAELLEHFERPRNVGELEPPAITIEASNPACGDILRLSVLMADGRVAAVRYKTRGCTAAIAAGSALTELMERRTRSELASIDVKTVSDAVGGLPPASQHVATLCVDAVKALLKQI